MNAFVLLYACLSVCVCILFSVVYQDGFYGADIYVSIIYWYDTACCCHLCSFSQVAMYMKVPEISMLIPEFSISLGCR